MLQLNRLTVIASVCIMCEVCELHVLNTLYYSAGAAARVAHLRDLTLKTHVYTITPLIELQVQRMQPVLAARNVQPYTNTAGITIHL